MSLYLDLSWPPPFWVSGRETPPAQGWSRPLPSLSDFVPPITHLSKVGNMANYVLHWWGEIPKFCISSNYHSSKPSSQSLLMGFTVFFPVLIIIREPHICIPNGPLSKVCWHFSRFWIACNASLNLGRCPQISLYGPQHIDCLLYSLCLIPGNLS